MDWNRVERLLDELIEGQQKSVLSCARRIVPGVTSDDILQPNDFPELENHPYFRYEEGVLSGLLTARTALRVEMRSINPCSFAQEDAISDSFPQSLD